jgi:phosphonate transport system substrate-binding protein
MEPTPDNRPPSRTNPVLLIFVAIVVAGITAAAMYFIQVHQPTEANKNLNSKLVQDLVGLNDAAPLKLADKFKDADGDLVADPADASQQIDPPTLMFSYVGSSAAEGERLRERFKEFVAYLTIKVGRPVEFVAVKNPEDELRLLVDGKLHIAGVNTGNIPAAVNQAGFVPICSLASDQGAASYQMQIIVPADSPIHTLADLNGRELTLTEPGSNSGFKAPLVLLRDNNLIVGRDFALRYSGGHEKSIEGIANHTYQAAAVASDVLKRVMGEDPPKIKKEQFRVIYESENFPTAGFGYVCTLKPEIAAKVKDAFFSFQWKGTGVEREFAASNQTKFIPVVFKNDFSLVRRIDNEIRSVRTSAEPDSESTTQPTTASSPATSAPAQ